MQKHHKRFGLTEQAVQTLGEVVEAVQMDPETTGYLDVGDVVSAAILAFKGLSRADRRRWMLATRQETQAQPEG